MPSAALGSGAPADLTSRLHRKIGLVTACSDISPKRPANSTWLIRNWATRGWWRGLVGRKSADQMERMHLFTGREW
jgi:hypothetical protein